MARLRDERERRALRFLVERGTATPNSLERQLFGERRIPCDPAALRS